MKFALEQIAQIIKEEIAAVLSEDRDRPDEELLDLVLDVAKDPLNAEYFDLQDIEDYLLNQVRAGNIDEYDEDEVVAAANYLVGNNDLEKLPNGDYKFIPEG